MSPKMNGDINQRKAPRNALKYIAPLYQLGARPGEARSELLAVEAEQILGDREDVCVDGVHL